METYFLQRTLATACFAALTVTSPMFAGPFDGMVIGVTKIVDNGPAAERFNIVLVSEGYQQSELPKFAQDAQEFVAYFFNTAPFNTNSRAFNIYRIDVKSTDSGADDPAPPADNPDTPEDESKWCQGGTGASARTYFDAMFCGDGRIRRGLVVNNTTVQNVLDASVPGWDSALVIVNSPIHGGTGGTIGTTSLSGTWENIAIHELGHSAFGLADEYAYYVGCDSETDRNNHPNSEPSEPNVTIQTDRTMIKWRDMIAPATAVPTTINADCSRCDSQPNPFPSMTVVGLYEGAHYYHCDAYRPAFDCMMRNLGAAFCPVCIRRIVQTLEPYQPAVTAVCVPDFVGYWKLDDGSGLLARDSSSNANHGTLVNGPTWTTGTNGGALNFDGVNDYVRVPDADVLEFAGRNFTVALWVRTTKAGSQMLVEKQHSGFGGCFLFALNRDSAVPGGFSVWTGNGWIDSNWRGATDGQWHHLAITYDGTTFRFYRDGAPDRTQASAVTYVQTASGLNFGRGFTGTIGWPLLGQLDDIRRYNRALSSNEIAGLTRCGELPPTVISGIVRTSGGAPIGGVVVNFSNSGGTATTDSSGNYSRVVPNGWSGTATPSASCYTFSPLSRSYSNVTASQSGQDYTGTASAFIVSGTVRTTNGTPIIGVNISFSNGGGAATTDGSGNYSQTVLCGWSGTATPSLGGYTFTPSSRTYSNMMANQTGQDYTGTTNVDCVPGYVGYWKLDDGSGLLARDSSSNANHGTLVNGPTWTTGTNGGALNFDGLNDYVRVPDADVLEFAGRNFTVALWVRTTKAGSQMLVEKQHSGFGGCFLFALNRDNAVPGGFSVWTGNGWIDSNWRGATDGQWHHLAITYDGTTFRFYRDGAPDRTQASAVTYVQTAFGLNFGRGFTGTIGWPLLGQLDDIRRYNRALSDQEIGALIQCGEPPPPSPEIGVAIGLNEITDGQATAIDFGSVVQGQTGPSLVFTVRNDGGQTLTLGAVSLPAGYTLTEPLAASLAPNALDTFTVRLDSVTVGTKSGQISFSNNDSNENPFNFPITGTVTPAPTSPEIGVAIGLNEITDGQATAIDFGSVVQGQPGPTVSFTVRNDGGQTLTLGALSLPAGYTLTEPLAASLAPNALDTFTVRLDSVTVGTKSGQISFSNNDSNENPFNFPITGTVTPAPPPPAGLVGHWKLDDGSGTMAMDASGSNFHGTLNGPVWTNGQCNGALSFDGVNDYVRVADADLLEFAGRNFTVALWVRTSKAGPQMLVEKQHSGFGGCFLFALNRDNAVPGGFSVWTGNGWIDSNWRGATNGQWHHLAITYDGMNFRFYRDGAPDRTQASAVAYVPTAFGLNFGRGFTSTIGWPLLGQLDDIRRYNRALSDAEIAGVMQCPPAGGVMLASALRAPTPALRLESLHRQADGTFRLIIRTANGTPLTPERVNRLEIFATSDLSLPLNDWTKLSIRPLWVDGTAQWDDPERLPLRQRFYILKEKAATE